MTPIKADDGYYVALFPADYLNLTQTWGAGTLSHRDHQTDWAFPSTEYPYYAPCPLQCYAVTSSGYIWTSTEQVHTPSGLSYISIWVAHDNDASRAAIGDTVSPGDLLGRSGVRGYATGDHLHLDCSLVQFDGYNSAGDALANDTSPINVFYLVKDEYTVTNLTANGITLSFEYWKETAPAPTVYTVTVKNGMPTTFTGAAGDTQTITADNPPSGKFFAFWRILEGSGGVSSLRSRSAVFTIQNEDATIEAVFETSPSLDLLTLAMFGYNINRKRGRYV